MAKKAVADTMRKKRRWYKCEYNSEKDNRLQALVELEQANQTKVSMQLEHTTNPFLNSRNDKMNETIKQMENISGLEDRVKEHASLQRKYKSWRNL